MADEIREVRSETRQEGDTTIERQSVDHDTGDRPAFKAQQVVYLIFGILNGLLAIRVVLSLLGANRSNGFADFIYSVTNPFVAPFRGLFGYDTEYGVSRFEVETLVAIIVYALLSFVLIKVFELTKKNPEV